MNVSKNKLNEYYDGFNDYPDYDEDLIISYEDDCEEACSEFFEKVIEKVLKLIESNRNEFENSDIEVSDDVEIRKIDLKSVDKFAVLNFGVWGNDNPEDFDIEVSIFEEEFIPHKEFDDDYYYDSIEYAANVDDVALSVYNELIYDINETFNTNLSYLDESLKENFDWQGPGTYEVRVSKHYFDEKPSEQSVYTYDFEDEEDLDGFINDVDENETDEYVTKFDFAEKLPIDGWNKWEVEPTRDDWDEDDFYPESLNEEYEEYKGYYIEHDFYGQDEYTVQYCGDDVIFKTKEEAKAFIDELDESLKESMWNTKFKGYWVSPDTNKSHLLCGTNDETEIKNMMKKQFQGILENPWNKKDEKIFFIKTAFVTDDSDGEIDIEDIKKEYIEKAKSLKESEHRTWNVSEPLMFDDEEPNLEIPKTDKQIVKHRLYGYGYVDKISKDGKLYVKFGEKQLLFDPDAFEKGYLVKVDESLKESTERTDDLDTGIKDETETIDLYDDFMKKDCFDETDKELIKGIRDDEKDHRRILRDMKAGKKNIKAYESLKESYGDWEFDKKAPTTEHIMELKNIAKKEFDENTYAVCFAFQRGNKWSYFDNGYLFKASSKEDLEKKKNNCKDSYGENITFHCVYNDDNESLKESEQPKSTKINIRESLNKMDWDTDNKYDLRNMYDASIMNQNDKLKLAKMISMNESYENISEFLNKFI